jgi:hypothetical protein
MATTQLLATVALLESAPSLNLVRGQVGTVVDLLSDSSVLVEFSDLDGQTISIEAFPIDQLLTLHYATSEQVA